MSNALEKTGNRMDEALARLRRERVANRSVHPSSASGFTRSSFAPSQEPARSNRKIVVQRCVCAVHDLEFDECFELQASGYYRPIEAVRVHAGEGFRHGVTSSQTLNVRDISGQYLPCPWCGENGSTRYHCDCGGVVCGGRVKGKLFVCRPSCGLEWKMGQPLHEIEVSEARSGGNDWKAPEGQNSTWRRSVQEVNPARLLAAPSKRR